MEEQTRIKKIVEEFMANKPKNRVYPVTFLNEETGEYVMYLKFTPEQVDAIRSVIEKYKMENFNDHIEEIVSPEDEPTDLFPDEVIDIDLATDFNAYAFTIHYMLKDGTMGARKIEVEDLPKNYARWLELCVEDKGMNFNKMRYADEVSYKSLLRSIDLNNCDDGFYIDNYPYLITMDELKADAATILENHPEIDTSYTFRGYHFF